MKRFWFVFIPLLLLWQAVQAQALDELIRIGLSQNPGLKEKEFALQKSLAQLDEARGRFFPALSIEARYSRADGGRSIDIPLGDLMNPVYAGINATRLETGLTPIDYPTLQNESTPFLRKEEQETKLRLVQPLFVPAIYFAWAAQKSGTAMAAAERTIYKRELISRIKTAYFNWQNSLTVVTLYGDVLKLSRENLRVHEKLAGQGMALRTDVLRLEAEQARLEQEELNARQQSELARFYLNSLINQPLETEIVAVEIGLPIWPPIGIEANLNHALQKREELAQLSLAVESDRQLQHLADASWLPNINLVADYGTQGEEFHFTEKDRYWMASAVLSWNLFNGGQDRARSRQAGFTRQGHEALKEQVEIQIKLQVRQTVFKIESGDKAVSAAMRRRESAGSALNDAEKRFAQGAMPLVEFLDYRNEALQADLNLLITENELQIARVELERVTAAYPIQ